VLAGDEYVVYIGIHLRYRLASSFCLLYVVHVYSNFNFWYFFFSLQLHKLSSIPDTVFSIQNLRILDLSGNNINSLPEEMSLLLNLKNLKCDNNKLLSLGPVEKLEKLQVLSAADNRLGAENSSITLNTLKLPSSVKDLNLASNNLQRIPSAIMSAKKLRILNLSNNEIVSIPVEICLNFTDLAEFHLDRNLITSLPDEIGNLTKLKVLSLQSNQISGSTTPQPLPAALFTDTSIIDISLRGNTALSVSQLNDFDGFENFLERRRKIKNKDLSGFDQLSGKYSCGLE